MHGHLQHGERVRAPEEAHGPVHERMKGEEQREQEESLVRDRREREREEDEDLQRRRQSAEEINLS